MSAELDGRVSDALARLPEYLGGHVRVSMAALALGIVLSVPLALASMRRPAKFISARRTRRASLAFTSTARAAVCRIG